MKGKKGFYFSASLTVALLMCTAVVFTVGKNMQMTVSPITAKSDYLSVCMETEGMTVENSRGEKTMVSVMADEKLALQIMGTGAEITGYFLEQIPGTESVMEEYSYKGSFAGKKAVNGKYEILLDFATEQWQETGVPVRLEIKRRLGPLDVIPQTAIQRDSRGDYVYEVKEKETMWGKQFFLEKYPITVLMQSEGKAAVSGLKLPDGWSDNHATKIAPEAEKCEDGVTVQVAS